VRAKIANIASVIIGESGHAREKRSRYKGSITAMPSLSSNGIWLISQVRKGKGASGFPPLPAQLRLAHLMGQLLRGP
jgi:hypothetical protein